MNWNAENPGYDFLFAASEFKFYTLSGIVGNQFRQFIIRY